METTELFDRLVSNMFENLSKSIDNIDNDKKTAVICYFSALELLFKARLLHEHWTLILDSPDVEDNKNIFYNFKEGNFKSIYFETAAKRIRNLLQDLDSKYEKNFDGIKTLRNKLIHFDYMTDKSSDLSVSNITMSWYYFYKLLNEKWKNIFINYQDKITANNKKMQKHSCHFWASKKKALIKDNAIKYQNNPKYKSITIENNPQVCNVCNISYDSENNISLLQTEYDRETYTLTTKCEICGNIESVFLPALYIKEKNLSIYFNEKLDNCLRNRTWIQDGSSSVNRDFVSTLEHASFADLDIDFSDLENACYDDFPESIYIEEIDRTSSRLIIDEPKDFILEDVDNFGKFYVLYSEIIFRLSLNKEDAENADFETLYNSIIDCDIEFYFDSDGY